MKKYLTIISLLLVSFLLLNSCNINCGTKDITSLKSIIIQTEKDFAKMAKQKGVSEAFLYYADDDAVLSRNNTLIKGKKQMKEYFEKQTWKEVKLQWKPDFIDVAKSGDMAYTYGHFSFSAIKPDGKPVEAEGVFHTVWKKQKDGKWKFVWD